ncbi:hypothetical protein F5B20DRAFT_558360 [Whalleya microplaca]|nr:hypothetical protein F5B20DRAFT_558360 [Whalleya microplaca]
MDDPWGSPWASSDTTSKHEPSLPSPPKSLLSPPPKAFFGAISNLSGQSPWADDDGFGDWSRGDQPENAASASEWGVWAEPPPQIFQPSPKPFESGKASSGAWPGSTSTSPGLRPLPRSRTSSIFRHHSPDPWAMEASLNDRANNHSPVPSIALGITTADIKDELVEEPKGSILKDKLNTINTQDEKDDTQRKEESDGEAIDEDEAQDLPPMLGNTEIDSNAEPKVESHDTHSRPSSAFSSDSFNGLERQDSPMTSIDEDPKSRLQTLSRKPSNKVQELVGMFDGLAKAIAEEPPVPERRELSRERDRRKSSSGIENADESLADFGEFEDAKSDGGKPPLNSTTSDRSPTPKAPLKAGAISPETTEPPIINRPTGPKAPSLPVQQLIEKFGPIRFDVDLQAIDNLFPNLNDSANDEPTATETSDLPDRVLNDSFTEISERKTWYRISRFGSMRLHDYGDEDNYHRVAWPTSHLHSDVIKIVRKWMEEDSISGRATLGGSKRTSVFNWDSSAAPVDLEKVFARKSSLTLPRPGSTPPSRPDTVQALKGAGSGHETRHSIGGSIHRPSIASKLSIAATPGFGWSSDATQSPTRQPTPSNHKKVESLESAIQTKGLVTGMNTGIKSPLAVPVPYQTSNLASTDAEDEDDDWGEMVSSPRVESQADSTSSLNNDTTTAETSSSVVSRGNNWVPKLSVAIPQTSQPPKQAPSSSAASSAITPRADPWPLADFSIFDKSARTPKSSRQDTWPLADFSVFKSPISRSKSTGMKSQKANSLSSLAKPLEHPQPSAGGIIDSPSSPQMPAAPLKAVLGPVQKSNQDQDSIVRNIVQNLPDLSYMLR